MENALKKYEPLFGSWHITEKLDEGSVGQLYQIRKTDSFGNDHYSALKGNSNIVSYEDHEIIRHEDYFGWDILIRMEQITPLLKYTEIRDLTEDDVLKMGIDICRGLSLCARHKIIHRDIKPENIFVSENAFMKRMAGNDVPAPQNGSPRLKAIVIRACSHDPAERYASAAEMLEDLESLREKDREMTRIEKMRMPCPVTGADYTGSFTAEKRL